MAKKYELFEEEIQEPESEVEEEMAIEPEVEEVILEKKEEIRDLLQLTVLMIRKDEIIVSDVLGNGFTIPMTDKYKNVKVGDII